MARLRGDGHWISHGASTYHVDPAKIRLPRIMGTGQVEFAPVLARLYTEIERRETNAEANAEAEQCRADAGPEPRAV